RTEDINTFADIGLSSSHANIRTRSKETASPASTTTNLFQAFPSTGFGNSYRTRRHRLQSSSTRGSTSNGWAAGVSRRHAF
ncbi:hypothetical protein CPB85DRAFT_1345347, partial [Mucidula mucida]